MHIYIYICMHIYIYIYICMHIYPSITDRGNFRNTENPGIFDDPPTFLKKDGSHGHLPGALRNDFSRRFSWCGSFLPP